MRLIRYIPLFVLCILCIIACICAFAPTAWFMDVDPFSAHQGPSLEHFLGTDHLGRDIFIRLAAGTTNVVFPGLLACMIASLVALPLAVYSGAMKSQLAGLLSLPLDIISAIPRFVFILLLCSIFSEDLLTLAIGCGFACAPSLGEAVRARIIQLRLKGHQLAYESHGISNTKILWFHFLWVGCRRLIGRELLGIFGLFTIIETSLSYLGHFGVQQPNPSWGNMLAFDWGDGRGSLLALWAPALAIWVVLFCLDFLRTELEDSANA
jgi:peptide/nickel transport system permease protein